MGEPVETRLVIPGALGTDTRDQWPDAVWPPRTARNGSIHTCVHTWG